MPSKQCNAATASHNFNTKYFIIFIWYNFISLKTAWLLFCAGIVSFLFLRQTAFETSLIQAKDYAIFIKIGIPAAANKSSARLDSTSKAISWWKLSKSEPVSFLTQENINNLIKNALCMSLKKGTYTNAIENDLKPTWTAIFPTHPFIPALCQRYAKHSQHVVCSTFSSLKMFEQIIFMCHFLRGISTVFQTTKSVSIQSSSSSGFFYIKKRLLTNFILIANKNVYKSTKKTTQMSREFRRHRTRFRMYLNWLITVSASDKFVQNFFMWTPVSQPRQFGWHSFQCL